MALLIVPAGASAASPVLEFVVPGNSFPVSLTTAGGEVTAEGFNGAVMICAHSSGQGEITGPRRAVAKFEFTGCDTKGGAKCTSGGAAGEEEIKTGEIGAELVYIAQAKHEVAILLNPAGRTYMEFKCGSESARGEGSFLAPGAPLNTETTSFTTTLSKSSISEGVQTPDEYEGAGGEKLKAIPLGEEGHSQILEPTGVESTITVTTAVPVEVRAITAEEIEAKQREEAKKQEASLKKLEEALNKAEEHAKAGGSRKCPACRGDQEGSGRSSRRKEKAGGTGKGQIAPAHARSAAGERTEAMQEGAKEQTRPVRGKGREEVRPQGEHQQEVARRPSGSRGRGVGSWPIAAVSMPAEASLIWGHAGKRV
jgi:hypothetical protein